MSRIDDLPADRRAVLQLLLKQGKSYDELAGLLRIDPATVRERARDALDRLGPAEGAGLAAERQDEIADYLLGQQTASERARTRELLEDSPEGRAWARVVAGELRPLAGDDLPDIPAEGTEVDEAFDALQARRTARTRQDKSSRLGGLILLLGVIVAIVVVVLVASGGSSDDGGSASTPAAPATASTTATTSTTAQPVSVIGQANLASADGKTSLAAVQLVKQGSQAAMVFQGQGIPQHPKNAVFAIWLTRKTGAPARLGFIDKQTPANGKLQFSGALPASVDPAAYDRMLVTRETTANPSSPGPTILSGALVKSAG
jgi:hypothetical protein